MGSYLKHGQGIVCMCHQDLDNIRSAVGKRIRPQESVQEGQGISRRYQGRFDPAVPDRAQDLVFYLQIIPPQFLAHARKIAWTRLAKIDSSQTRYRWMAIVAILILVIFKPFL